MFRNSHVAEKVDAAVRSDGKNYLLEPDPTKMCIAILYGKRFQMWN